MAFELLDYDVIDQTAQITMHRKPVNAINHDLATEINDAYRLAGDDDSVRSIILTSAFDRGFSAVMALEMVAEGSGLQLRRFLETLYFELHDLQSRMGKATIAALRGPAPSSAVPAR